MNIRTCVQAFWLSIFLASMVPAADDAIQAKLDKAKAAYDLDAAKFRADVVASFDKREEAARKVGDKKAVDQIKAERQAFEEKGDLPKSLPATLKGRRNPARNVLANAYRQAIKDFTKAKRDDDAARTEKELSNFLNSVETRSMLNELIPKVNKHVGNLFASNGTILGRKVIVLGKEYPHAIFCHPPGNGQSELVYKVTGHAQRLRGGGAVPRLGDETSNIGSELTFEVFADGRLLWRSKPVREYDKPQWFDVSIEGAKEVSLRVRCPGSDFYARAVWLDPYLTGPR